jgi:hypothetical protein
VTGLNTTGMLYAVISLFTVTGLNTTGMLYAVISLYLL